MPASIRGPRSIPEANWEYVSSIDNGIWLCANHADVVDANSGTAFPFEVLRSYKRIHEERISQEQRGVSRTFGWLEDLIVERGPVFVAGSRLTLGKITLLFGPNGTGKTALCDWIAGAADPFTLHRWSRGASPTAGLRYRVRYHSPSENVLLMSLTTDSIDLFGNDGKTFLLSPMPFSVVMLREPHLQGYQGRRDGESDLDILSRLLRLDSSIVWNALKALERYGTGRVRNPKLVTNEPGGPAVVCLDVEGTAPGLSYLALSDGEKACVHIEIAIVVATISAHHCPTLLLIDGWLSQLSLERVSAYVRLLNAADRPFQSVLAGWHLGRLREVCPFAEYVHLKANGDETSITQGLEARRDEI